MTKILIKTVAETMNFKTLKLLKKNKETMMKFESLTVSTEIIMWILMKNLKTLLI